VILSLVGGKLSLLINIVKSSIIEVDRSCEVGVLFWVLIVLFNPDSNFLEVVLNHCLCLTVAKSDLNTASTSASTLHMVLVDL
jgi:hypothetical protein